MHAEDTCMHNMHAWIVSMHAYYRELPGSYPPWRVTPAGALNGASDYFFILHSYQHIIQACKNECS